MLLTEIINPPRQIQSMSDAERHTMLKFIGKWLAGTYMVSTYKMKTLPHDPATMWQQIAKLFPPKVPAQLRLFRLMTVPLAFAKKQHFAIKPAPGRVSSWSGTLVGIDAVAGVATDMLHNYGSYKDKTETARVAIEATIPGSAVLATPRSIRDAFMALSHDYFERYPEVVHSEEKDGRTYVSYSHPGYPGGDDASFDMNEVGFYQDVLNRPGGAYRQYEYVVRTPPRVEATLVQVYRIGNETIRIGNDDPHSGPTSVRRLRFKAA